MKESQSAQLSIPDVKQGAKLKTATIVREKIVVHRVKCKRCDHKWTPRRLSEGALPVACPHCYSRDWNTPRAYQKAGKPAPARRRAARSSTRSTQSSDQ